EFRRVLFRSLDIKLHPVMGYRDSTLLGLEKTLIDTFSKNQDKVEIHSKDVPVEEIIKDADIYICDISAVVSECISTLSPIFLFVPNDREIITSASNMQRSEERRVGIELRSRWSIATVCDQERIRYMSVW